MVWSLLQRMNKMKCTPCQYGAWWWGVLCNETGLMLRKEDGKLKLFRTKKEAQEYCDWVNSYDKQRTFETRIDGIRH